MKDDIKTELERMERKKMEHKIISRMIGETVRFSSGNTGKVMEVRQAPDDLGPTYTVAMPNGELCSVYYNRVRLVSKGVKE